MTRRLWQSLSRPGAFALVIALGAACEERSDTAVPLGDGGAAVATTELDLFIDRAAAAACSWQFRCCSLPDIETQTGAAYLTEADCRTAISRLLNRSLSEVRIAFGNGHLSIDPALAAACVEQVMSGQCAPSTQIAEIPLGADRLFECASPFVGHLPPDALCLLAAECRPGSSCNPGSNSGPTPGGLRAAVSIGIAVSPYIGHCQLDTREGQPCFLTTECPVGMYCRRPDFVCARPGAEGEACDVQQDMFATPQGSVCAEGPQELLCVANRCRRLPRRDEPCLVTNDPAVRPRCDPAPDLGLTCVGENFDGSGICKPFGRHGETCSEGGGLPPCEQSLVCAADSSGLGTCQPAPAIGASCGRGQCAWPGICYNGGFSVATCVVPPPVRTGATCHSDLDCASLNCVRDSNTPGAVSRCAHTPFPVGCDGRSGFVVMGQNPPLDSDRDGGASGDAAEAAAAR